MLPLECILGCCGTPSVFSPTPSVCCPIFFSKGQVGHKFTKSSDGGSKRSRHPSGLGQLGRFQVNQPQDGHVLRSF